MRFLLTLMAMTVFAISLGCDNKPEATSPTIETGDTAKGTSEVLAPGEDAHDGDDHADDSSATSDTSGTQKVSLKLPGMTWGGCAASVRSALESVDGIKDIKTNVSDNTASFVAPAGLDVEATLNKFAEEGNKHIAGWSKAE